MANINSKTEARKRVREAQARANEARLESERQNVDDAASFLVELGRLAAVDEWEQRRVLEVRAEAERRRHEHRQAGAAAVTRMLDRGEMLTSIAELAGVKVSEVRAVLNRQAHSRSWLQTRVAREAARRTRPVPRPDSRRRGALGDAPTL
jgi:hypothetical protein